MRYAARLIDAGIYHMTPSDSPTQRHWLDTRDSTLPHWRSTGASTLIPLGPIGTLPTVVKLFRLNLIDGTTCIRAVANSGTSH